MLLVTAGGIAWHALDVLVGVLYSAASDQHIGGGHDHGIDMNHPVLALNTTIVAIAVKEGLYWITKRAGERSGSGLMKANAWHHRADAVSSLVALIGVGGSIVGVRFLDPLAGLVVSGMILKAGLQTGYESILELVDAAIPSHHLDPIRKTVLQVKGVEGCRHIRGRRAGSYLYLDVKIQVDPLCSVRTAHEIGETVRYQIQNCHPQVSEVFIHLEPNNKLSQPTTTTTTTHVHAQQQENRIEEMITDMLTSNFSQKMNVKHVRKQKLQGQILVQIEVSMPQDKTISDAIKVAEEAKRHILQLLDTSDSNPNPNPIPTQVQVTFILQLA